MLQKIYLVVWVYVYIFIYFILNKSNQSLSHGEQDLKVKCFTHLISIDVSIAAS